MGPTHVDMSVAAVLRFPGNVLALVDASFVAPFRTEVEVVGSAGSIRVSHPFKPGQRETCSWSAGDEVLEHVVEASPLYVAQFEDFGRAARGERGRRQPGGQPGKHGDAARRARSRALRTHRPPTQLSRRAVSCPRPSDLSRAPGGG